MNQLLTQKTIKKLLLFLYSQCDVTYVAGKCPSLTFVRLEIIGIFIVLSCLHLIKTNLFLSNSQQPNHWPNCEP